jgi:hypothetical protein
MNVYYYYYHVLQDYYKRFQHDSYRGFACTCIDLPPLYIHITSLTFDSSHLSFSNYYSLSLNKV